MRNYTDWDGDDVPGKGIVAFDRQSYDNVIYGFLSHKAGQMEVETTIRDFRETNKQIQ